MPEPSSNYGTPDADSPEWTRETFQKAVRLPDFPPELKAVLARQQSEEASSAQATQPVSLNVAAEVVHAMKSSGPGWQKRAEQALRTEFLRSSDAA